MGRGREEEEKITREFQLRGEMKNVTVKLDLKIAEGMRQYFDRFLQFREDLKQELIKKAEKILADGEAQCTEMIDMACEDIIPDSDSDEFCAEFTFFTNDLDKRRRRFKRKQPE